jgi:hypothetical protein
MQRVAIKAQHMAEAAAAGSNDSSNRQHIITNQSAGTLSHTLGISVVQHAGTDRLYKRTS